MPLRLARRGSALVLLAALALRSPLAGAAPAPLPDWDAATKGEGKKGEGKKGEGKTGDGKPSAGAGGAALPDWDAEAKKGAKKPAPAKQPAKKPGKKPTKAAAEPEAGDEPADAPVVEPTAEVAPAAGAEAAAEAETQAEVVAPAAGGGAPAVEVAPEGPREPERLALRQANAAAISGGVLTGLGVAGFAVMAVGLAGEEGAAGRDTRIAAGAVSGAIGVAMGLALLGQGLRDRKASRGEVARLRAAPTLGGVVVLGRF